MTTASASTVFDSSTLDYPCLMDANALAHFRLDHPDSERTIFLIMRFELHPLLVRIHRLVSEVAHELDYDLLRADDRDYSGELWTNVKLCMDNSALAIAIFDEEIQDFQNLALELGYMFARGVPCLIMRERRLAHPPAMLAHRLHTIFEAYDLEGTLLPAVRTWLGTQRRPRGDR